MPAESALRDGSGTGYELIETLRWERDAGFVRLDRHLARLYASAEALGFRADPQRIGEVLSSALTGEPTQRVRLTLNANGDAQATSQPFALQPSDTVWKLRIARTRLNSADPLLRHKTTRREVYETARAEFTHKQADEVVLLNERGELCEGAITTLFLDMGDGRPLRTPALSSGLLAGVLRAEMIETGKAVEAVLRPEQLADTKTVWVGNSLRGKIRAELTDHTT